jgi:hypothetical protein
VFIKCFIGWVNRLQWAGHVARIVYGGMRKNVSEGDLMEDQGSTPLAYLLLVRKSCGR